MGAATSGNIEKILGEKAPLIDRTIEKYLPKKYNEKSMEFTFGKARYRFSAEAADKALAVPVWDLLGRGGKRWRPFLFLTTCEALGGNPKKFLDFVALIELIHNGSLIIDDIEDSSELRRGKPCTYKIFGTDTAVNAGNFMYFAPLLVLLKSKMPEQKKLRAYEIYAQELINIHLGQAMDILWHRGIAEPAGEQEYLQMCAFKTGTLARLAAKLGALCAGADEKTMETMGALAESLGVAFQIQDDVLNLTAASNKGQFVKHYLGEDIHEGKRTLMVIRTLEKASATDRKRLVKILSMHTSDKKLINEAIAILNRYGAIDYAKERAKSIVKKSWGEADKILRSSQSKDNLKALVSFAIEREF
ncbi:MAG: polyprenyl synthetase family protein [Candidatus Aenigmarchaeota archaeon]|nr:polyprenyl synthetase family protein [Candidatus Aenigmarchaeota archaeon]